MSFSTADLCDQFNDKILIADPRFVDFGGKHTFWGRISTVKCHEDNSMVRAAFETIGDGRVLVVDGGESLRCAQLGDQLALLATTNGWTGAIINGCIRDSAKIATIEFGTKALATHPLKSIKKGIGERDIPVRFAGVTFVTGNFVYADQDGIVISSEALI